MDLPTRDDLRERRNELGLTQSELADRADVSQPLIARIEGGDVDPRLSTLRAIVTAIGEVEGDIVRAEDVMNETVISVAPDNSVSRAIDIMGEEGYSQLPVLEDGYPKGMISNADIRHTSADANPAELPVADVMRHSVTTIEPDETLDEVDARLDHTKAVIVVDEGEVKGIITEADVAARYS